MNKREIIRQVTEVLEYFLKTEEVQGPLVLQVKLDNGSGEVDTVVNWWRCSHPRAEESLPPPSPQAIVALIRDRKRAMIQQQSERLDTEYKKLMEASDGTTLGQDQVPLEPPTPDCRQRMLAWYKFDKPVPPPTLSEAMANMQTIDRLLRADTNNWFVSAPSDPSNYTLADDDEVKPDHVVPR